MIRYSLLDLAPIAEGSTASDAFRHSLDLARKAEAWGYHRFWLAEHHGMPGIASAATAVVIAHVAGGTERIRVGSGGVMLPNHAPLVIAEQFGTLESLFPGRIDLGLGRAPGTDQATAYALRRDLHSSAEQFPQDVQELRRYFGPLQSGQHVKAIPGLGLGVPIWLLGSSTYSAQLAAELGLPFAFASHFAPGLLDEALAIYRRYFRPSEQWPQSYAMAAMNVFGAETDEAGAVLMSSAQQQFLALRRGHPGPLPPPVPTMAGRWSDAERSGVEQALACSAVGSPESLRQAIARFVERTGVDEVMFAGQIYDHQARLRSFEMAAEAVQALS
ncbi:LLM class flavin-dependent oxidoreductase [Frateuria aurantia]